MKQLGLQCFKYLTSKSIIQKDGNICEYASSDFIVQDQQQPHAIDPDFPHLNRSISNRELKQSIVWLPVSQLIQGDPCYTQSIDNIEMLSFSKISIKNSLLIIKWFCPTIFKEILNDQKVQPTGIYKFSVLYKGVIVNLWIDEYVPVSSKQEIFAKHYKNSIFPNLYEKMLAKAYGSYSQISNSIVDLVQLQTMFCRQQRRTSQFKDQQQSLALMVARKTSSEGMVFFRTKQDQNVQNVGLLKNQEYLISRIVNISGKFIIQFLQSNQGRQKYRGRFSKFSGQDWKDSMKQCQQLDISFSQLSRQNYMRLSDLLMFSKTLTFLRDTKQMNKMWISEIGNKKQLKFYEFEVKSKACLMIKLQLLQKCRNTVFLIRQVVQNEKTQYFVQDCSFKSNRTCNFIENSLTCGKYHLVVYNDNANENAKGIYDDIGHGFNITIFATQQIILQPEDQNMLMLQKSLVSYLKKQNYPKLDIDLKNNSFAIMKQFYEKMGLAVIYVEIGQLNSEKAVIQISNRKLLQSRMQPFNFVKQSYEIRNNSNEILIFKCFWENIKTVAMFPPKDSIKILVKSGYMNKNTSIN